MYIVTSADYHQSEYVCEHFRTIEFLTGFTGENATAVFDENGGRLWVDGRFFIQAPIEIAGRNIELMKMGEPGIPSVTEYLEASLKQGDVLCFDGRTLSALTGIHLAEISRKCGAELDCEFDPVPNWTSRPSLPSSTAWELDVKYAGETRASKLSRVRKVMKAVGANTQVLTTLDDINWILNIRGGDIAYSPLVLCYAVVTMESFELYVDESKFDANLRKVLMEDGVNFHPYDAIYDDVSKFESDAVVLLDPDYVNFNLYNNIPDCVEKVETSNPVMLMKAIKNDVEIANIREAQRKDAIAHVEFMRWVKENYDKQEITEMSAMDKLEELRKEQGGYIEPSFESISAMGEHAAIIHYTSKPETNSRLSQGLYLTDTGAHFREGTTDITRTYALGEISYEMKRHYTAVVKANLVLANAVFTTETTGAELDIIARSKIQELGLDYNHGTGHGIGYLLNVHEDPYGISRQGIRGEMTLRPGVIVTDEPGIYIEGSHGIRLENELLCIEGEKEGELRFEVLTHIPFDMDAIDLELMNEDERRMLEDYHKSCNEARN